MQKAVAYARFSSENQRTESIDAQLRAIRKYCEDNKISLVKTYRDEAKSAVTADRPAFQQMIADSEDGDFDFVIVHKFDRFSRDRRDSIMYKTMLQKRGIRVISVSEPLNDSPESVILESVIEGMAQYYSMNLSREVMKGLKENALNCKHIGGKPLFGYAVDPETHRYMIVEDEAVAVRYMYDAVIRGVGYSEIINYLDTGGFRTRCGNPFSKTTINAMLQNEKYMGTYVFTMKVGKNMKKRRTQKKSNDPEEVIRIPHGVPAIVSEETFLKVQEIIGNRRNKNVNRQAKEVYLLAGKIRCGECGAAYCGSRKYSGRNKTLHVTYRCNNRTMKTSKECSNTEVNRGRIEEYVLGVLSDVIFNEKIVPDIIAKYNNEVSETAKEKRDLIRSMEHRVKMLENNISNVVNVIAHSGSSHLLDKLDSLESEQTELLQKIHDEKLKIIEAAVDDNVVREAFLQAKALFESGQLADMRYLINLYLNEVTIYKDRIEVSINALPGYILPNKQTLDVDVSAERKRKNGGS